ncbi:hypothetical protein CCACVL1_17514 [Corchorus capsularis]|uniref:Uncharacterized protein n=1 Tax=Corchorus capsularis TaxID=210143 RepID=A0A1R3HRU1_COCAP|nr:hypothetical protein CCACVL1_17514 [Corchorus capsularis]
MGFVGTDNNGDAIHVQIPRRAVNIHRPFILEDSLYVLSGFRVTMPQIRFIAMNRS